MLHPDLYRLGKKERKAAAEIFAEAFQQDPLFCRLIPEETLRGKILPELFDCYLTMYRDCFDLYADSEDLNGVIAIIDGTQHHCRWACLLEELAGSVRILWLLARTDPALGILRNFIRGRVYLSSSWQEELEELEDHQYVVRIDLFAVRREKQGTGVAGKLMKSVLQYADDHDCFATLETHNLHNVDIYHHYGFATAQILSAGFALHQYCMVR